MINLINHIETLRILIPILYKVKTESCCEKIRNEHIEILLTDFYNEIGLDTKEIKNDPMLAYRNLRKLILQDESLTPEEKLSLVLNF